MKFLIGLFKINLCKITNEHNNTIEIIKYTPEVNLSLPIVSSKQSSNVV